MPEKIAAKPVPWIRVTQFAIVTMAVIAVAAALEATGEIAVPICAALVFALRSEEHTSELQSLLRISYAVFCLKKKKQKQKLPDKQVKYTTHKDSPQYALSN